MNSFLEEIRRSKDNGARMLNYSTMSQRDNIPPSMLPERKQPRQESLSSRVREKLQNKEGIAQVNIHATSETLEHKAILQTESRGVSQISDALFSKQNDVIAEEQSLQIEEMSDIVKDETPPDVVINIEDNMDTVDEDDEIIPDDDYLKKYYYDTPEVEDTTTSATQQSYYTSVLSNDEDIEEIESSESTVTEDDKNENAEQELENLYKKFEHEGVKVFAPDEFVGLSPEEEILGNDITMPSSDVDLAEDNDASVEQLSETSNKNKIESNVNIDIGSGTKVTDGFMNIPLTVSAKPSELDAPPKKKRGRPPKKKKNKI